MVERELERTREPEPQEETLYDKMLVERQEFLRQRREGAVVVKYDERPWQQARQALLKFYSFYGLYAERAAPGWNVFQQRIIKHSGKHVHQGGLGIYIIDGKGYSIVDDVRYDWKAGDLILLPVKKGGCVHQHFNEEPDKPSHWLCLNFSPWFDFVMSVTRQLESHPDWAGKK